MHDVARLKLKTATHNSELICLPSIKWTVESTKKTTKTPIRVQSNCSAAKLFSILWKNELPIYQECVKCTTVGPKIISNFITIVHRIRLNSKVLAMQPYRPSIFQSVERLHTGMKLGSTQCLESKSHNRFRFCDTNSCQSVGFCQLMERDDFRGDSFLLYVFEFKANVLIRVNFISLCTITSFVCCLPDSVCVWCLWSEKLHQILGTNQWCKLKSFSEI